MNTEETISNQPESGNSTPEEEHPKTFISYSWTSEDHQQWVLNLATQLRSDGVDAILDKWDLHEGDDAHAFMESMVTDPSVAKVLLICDRLYVKKANDRVGGVGTEAQIITGEIYNRVKQDKFVAIIRERDENGKALVPAYYGSRIFIDMSDDDSYAQNYEQLLRWMYNKPIYLKPDIGSQPAFLTTKPSISLGTTTVFYRALDAIKNRKNYWLGALADYFDTFVINLENFRIETAEGEYDDQVIKSIEDFLPFRNEAISIFKAIARYAKEPESYELVHGFFEQLIPYMNPKIEQSSWRTYEFDNFRFCIHELFLYVIAIFLKYKCYEGVSYLLTQQFYVKEHSGKKSLESYSYLHQQIRSLDYRNKRLELKRRSLRADFLVERLKYSGISLDELMEADFLLYIRAVVNSVKSSDWSQQYWPDSLLYLPEYSGTIELFTRAESKQYFDEIKILLNITSVEDLEPIREAIDTRNVFIPNWGWKHLNPLEIMGISKIATKP